MTTENTVIPSTAQGGNKIKVDVNALVILSAEIKSPRPSAVKDPEATKLLRATSGDAYDAVTDMLRDTNGKVYEELKAVTRIRGLWKKFEEKYAINFSVSGMRVISVHHMDMVKTKIIEINDELSKQAEVIASKLPEWRETAIKRGNYISKKFPTAAYFDNYGIKSTWLKFDSAYDSNADLEEIKEDALGKMRETVETCITNLTKFLTSEKRTAFHESNVTKLCETAQTLKESGIISSEVFDGFCEKVIKVANETNVSAIREAKKKVDNGVTKKVSSDIIKDCQKVLDETLTPFEELSKELEGLI